MGSLWFHPETLGDHVSETAGYKSGLALSLEQMCDHLSGTHYPDTLIDSETEMIRIRSEDYEELFGTLLHRIGYVDTPYTGDTTGIGLYHKYKGTELEAVLEGVLELFLQIMPKQMEAAQKSKTKALDPTPFLKAANKKYGRPGFDIAIEKIMAINAGIALSPYNGRRFAEWNEALALDQLFSGGKQQPEGGRFIDQRFINYLNANHPQLLNMHWRKFEELTAEYFSREGYQVELGPGSNDDGVDVRIWNSDQDQDEEPPHIIVQCKRSKNKVEKLVVKGLYSDVEFQEADYGLLVTTSELSPGARETISARGYPISEIDNQGIRDWLNTLQQPGTGIVRV